jgi:hypothetical protein
MTASSPIALRLAPLQTDPEELGIENGRRIWRVTADSPEFAATIPENGTPLDPGWYYASAIIECRSGDVRDPRIYIPDAAGNFSEDRSVPLVRKGAAYAAEIFLPHAMSRLRFDPSDSRCEFACDSLQVARIDGPAPGPTSLSLPSSVRSLLRRIRSRLRLPKVPSFISPQPARPSDRKERVLATIDRNGLGIEIGPSHDPIAPKREGFKVQVIDHASREELVRKYATHGITQDRIEEVDFIWRGETYLELTGKPKHYDWIIASHLIEHTPDLIAFLDDCDSILRDGGVLSLVIPDKRYTFDRFRPISGLARILDCHLLPGMTHSPGSVAEHYMNVAVKALHLGWGAGMKGDYIFVHSASEAREKIRDASTKDLYQDVHNWCFVPHSFRLLLNDLHTLGYTRLREVHFHGTEGCEFYVTLGRHGGGPPMSRREMLEAIDAELASTD